MLHVCPECGQKFGIRSNLNRHRKTHQERAFKCEQCGDKFTRKEGLDRHAKVHDYPVIPLYKQREARLENTEEGQRIWNIPEKEKLAGVNALWRSPITAESEAKKNARDPDLWRLQLVIPFGKFAGQTFKWMLENGVGYVIWLVDQFIQNGEHNNPDLRWQKEQLLTLIKSFPLLVEALEKQQKKRKKPTEPGSSTVQPFEDEYVDDAELLSLVDDVLQGSDVSASVSSQLTTADQLLSKPSTSTPISTPTSSTTSLEGWQKTWEGTMYPPNIQWTKSDGPHGLFTRSGSKTMLRPCMEFYPPPPPTSGIGIPPMLPFFATKVFFWRPVGVLHLKIPCPNAKCPAPPDTFLAKSGFSTISRQVCSFSNSYTLLTERLQCFHCMKEHHKTGGSELQYRWIAYSPSILMNLPRFFSNLFPAIICGKRAIDKELTLFLRDRLNALSMTKLHRVVKEGHDTWYATRRGVYQTVLQSMRPSASTSQKGIVDFLKPEGTYTPPIPQPPIPCSRVLRRALLIQDMEQIDVYRESILSQTGEILCLDGTKQILKKIKGDGQGTMQYLTTVLNEWGQMVTTVCTASESEEAYRRMAHGLVARFKRANAPAPKILYTDTNCCKDGGASWLETIFQEWTDEGMVLRLDIRHWLHRWDCVVIKQSHAKYPPFMRALAGAILAYNDDDLTMLINARRKDPRFAGISDDQMISHLKTHDFRTYVRRVTRGVEVSVCAVEAILDEFKGPAGLDIDGIHLFKSMEAVDAYWAVASKHIACMQDPPGIALYVITKTAKINGVDLNVYRCRRGSNSLEGLHAHIVNSIPSQGCGIVPFQVALLAFAVQWNKNMESRKVSKEKRQVTSLVDPRQIQLLNNQSEILFGKKFEPNFVAPMPLPDNHDEEELLGVEYVYAQSTEFTPKNFYISKVKEEQQLADEEEDHPEDATDDDDKDDEDDDEGIEDDSTDDAEVDPIDEMCVKYSSRVKTDEKITCTPAQEDVLMRRKHLHLPGYEEVEQLALLLVKLADNSDLHIIPDELRLAISKAVAALHDHDKSARSFVKKYESKWGYTLFGRCLGEESPEASAAQKTKFGWMKYAQAARITDESRLLYVMIKMLKNRPEVSTLSSPTKIASRVKGQYKRIVDRIRDDRVLADAQIPLPNINVKSISAFLNNEDKRSNYLATVVPKAPSHRRVISTNPIPAAATLPSTLSIPNRKQIQYPTVPLQCGVRSTQKRKLDLEAAESEEQPSTSTSLTTLQPIAPRPSKIPKAPVLVVVPLQPSAASVSFPSTSAPFIVPRPPPPPRPLPIMPNRSKKPCTACGVFNCGGKRKRYQPSKDKLGDSSQKMFTFCPVTRKSVTMGFTDREYDSFEHFKEVVDARLAQNN